MENSLFTGSLVHSRRILYTASTFAKTSLIHLQETGSLEAKVPHTNTRSNLVSFLLFTVRSGSGTLDYNGTSYSLNAGDCVFIDCKKPYAHTSSMDLWTLSWVHFYGPNMNSIYEKYVERGGRPAFHPENFDSYVNLIEELYELASDEDFIKDMKIYERITTLLTLIMEESWHPETVSKGTTKKQNLQNVKDYLDLHYQERVSLEQLSDVFFINKFYLSRIFKEQFGISINRYLLQIKITHAKQLLRFSDLTIEAIGAECGIGDSNYFTRMFKKIEGVSPGTFRRLWQN